jgi:hypothetical protein
MKISFAKTGKTPIEFEETLQGCRLKGSLLKISRHEVELDSTLEGEIEMICDRCGEEYLQRVESPLKLTLSEVAVEGRNDLDIMEFPDGMIDIASIIESEINAMTAEYHYCPVCSKRDEAEELEF